MTEERESVGGNFIAACQKPDDNGISEGPTTAIGDGGGLGALHNKPLPLPRKIDTAAHESSSKATNIKHNANAMATGKLAAPISDNEEGFLSTSPDSATGEPLSRGSKTNMTAGPPLPLPICLCTNPNICVNLKDILDSFKAPLSEEQAWALLHQFVSLYHKVAAAEDKHIFCELEIPDAIENVNLHRDGTVHCSWTEAARKKKLRELREEKLMQQRKDGQATVERGEDNHALLIASHKEVIRKVAVIVYTALDYNLQVDEQCQISQELEELFSLMTSEEIDDDCIDEGIDEGYKRWDDENDDDKCNETKEFDYILEACRNHIKPTVPEDHYTAVCRALVTETIELRIFLQVVLTDGGETLHIKADTQTSKQELAKLGFTDWARFWVQVMDELRQGVRLKKKPFMRAPIEYELTPYEILMEDIRSKKYQLRKVGDLPPRVKKDAHAMILEFIRSRPPLKKASERQLPPPIKRTPSPREQLMDSIRKGQTLKHIPPPPQPRLKDRLQITDQSGAGGQETAATSMNSKVSNAQVKKKQPAPPPPPSKAAAATTTGNHKAGAKKMITTGFATPASKSTAGKSSSAGSTHSRHSSNTAVDVARDPLYCVQSSETQQPQTETEADPHPTPRAAPRGNPPTPKPRSTKTVLPPSTTMAFATSTTPSTTSASISASSYQTLDALKLQKHVDDVQTMPRSKQRLIKVDFSKLQEDDHFFDQMSASTSKSANIPVCTQPKMPPYPIGGYMVGTNAAANGAGKAKAPSAQLPPALTTRVLRRTKNDYSEDDYHRFYDHALESYDLATQCESRRASLRRHTIVGCQSNLDETHSMPPSRPDSRQSEYNSLAGTDGVSATKQLHNNFNQQQQQQQLKRSQSPSIGGTSCSRSSSSVGPWNKSFLDEKTWHERGDDRLSLTLEEIVHIRSVMTKAELEALPVGVRVKEDVEKRKVCFLCLRTRFSIFGPWGIQCKLCQRTVCSKCHTKMRIPTEHFRNVPLVLISPSLLASPAGSSTPSPSHHAHHAHSSSTGNILDETFPKSLIERLLRSESERKTRNTVGSAPSSPKHQRSNMSTPGITVSAAGHAVEALHDASSMMSSYTAGTQSTTSYVSHTMANGGYNSREYAATAHPNNKHISIMSRSMEGPRSLPVHSPARTHSNSSTLDRKSKFSRAFNLSSSGTHLSQDQKENMRGEQVHVCNDCKGLVMEITRSSKQTRSSARNRALQNLTLDLSPVYK